MKVIKRDGRIVEYDKKKIITAIEKANCDVPLKEQAKKKDIDKIISYIESLNKKKNLSRRHSRYYRVQTNGIKKIWISQKIHSLSI